LELELCKIPKYITKQLLGRRLLHSFGFAIGLAQALADKGKCVQFAVG
jgi:hypothetical protein